MIKFIYVVIICLNILCSCYSLLIILTKDLILIVWIYWNKNLQFTNLHPILSKYGIIIGTQVSYKIVFMTKNEEYFEGQEKE